MKKPNPWIVNYYTVFIFRRMVFGMVLVLASDYPLVQVGVITLTSLMILIWLLACKPLSNPKIQLL